jgi:hypothetical protein
MPFVAHFAAPAQDRLWHFTTNSIAWNFRSLLGVQRTWRDVPPSPAPALMTQSGGQAGRNPAAQQAANFILTNPI